MREFTYVRWRVGEPRESKIFDPLKKDHPLVAEEGHCNLCSKDFKEGDLIQLLALGADSEEGRNKLKQDRWFSALAIVFHVNCMTGKTDAG